MLSKRGAVELASNIINGPRRVERGRLDRIADAMRPVPEKGQSFRTSIELPQDAPATLIELARKSRTNYLPLLVKTFGQVLKVNGFDIQSDATAETPWWWWQRNRMDSRQTGLHRATIQYGTAYATALPGVDHKGRAYPRIDCFSPRQMTAVYADVDDEWPQYALSIDRGLVTLVDEEAVYTLGLEKQPQPWEPSPRVEGGNLTFISASVHGLGYPPVVRYHDRHLLAGEETCGIVEPLFAVQDRIDETTFELSVAQFFGAFRQRYVLGWVPASEEEELRASGAKVWYFEGTKDDVHVGELEQTALGGYLDSLASAKRDFAAIGQIPAQSLGVDAIANISDATLAGLEAAKNREAGEITTSLGESHEQLMRLCGELTGDAAAADDYAAETLWKDLEARSIAQVVDAAGKLAQMLGLPPELALEQVPGMSGQKLQRAQDAIRAAREADEARADRDESETSAAATAATRKGIA